MPVNDNRNHGCMQMLLCTEGLEPRFGEEALREVARVAEEVSGGPSPHIIASPHPSPGRQGSGLKGVVTVCWGTHPSAHQTSPSSS